MSNYFGYRPEDNFRRKENNTGESYDSIGKNRNEKEYTSAKMGSAKTQATREADRLKRLNRKQPVKIYTREEIMALGMKVA